MKYEKTNQHKKNFTGDATNTDIWQHHKVRVAETESYYIVEPYDNDSQWDEVKQSIESRRSLGTLQVVEYASGLAVHALVQKQAQSSGVPPWTKAALPPLADLTCTSPPNTAAPAPPSDPPLPSPSDDPPGPPPRLKPWNGIKVLRLVLSCTDGGPDEKFAREVMRGEVASDPAVWAWDADCH